MAAKPRSGGLLSFLIFFVLLSSLLFSAALTADILLPANRSAAMYPKEMIVRSLNDMAPLIAGEQNLSQQVREDLYYNLHYVVEEKEIYYNSADDLKMTYEQFVEQFADQGILMLSWVRGEMPEVRYSGSYFLIDQKTITDEIAQEAISILDLYSQQDVQRLAFVISDELAYNTPMYYANAAWQEASGNLKICFYSSLCLFFITIAFFIMRRQAITAFNEELAQTTGWLWIELKVLLLLILTTSALSVLPLPLAVIGIFWLIYLCVNEFHFLGLKSLRHNLVNSLFKTIRAFSGQYGYQKKWIAEFALLVIFEVLCAFVLWTMMFGSFFGTGGLLLFLAVFTAAFAALFFYGRKMLRFMQDTATLAMQVENIRKGKLNEALELSEGSPLQPVSENLEKIREGVSHQVEEQLKNEKLKIELITNVSHDLKTPITSLINYSDLLMKAQIEPDYARDYVKIIAQKSLRLKNLVQDLFEISKAASGNLQMDLQQLEINGLLMQTLGELEEKIEASSLEFKVQYLDTSGMILADGSRLYNVFDNLISNAIKYSMENTRVYIRVEREDGQICISFKNIANYELNFDPGSLTERFVRGDVARSTEGSGLGLAIAETFVQLMNGTIEISADGDLFKIEVRFPELRSDSPAEV